MVWLVKHIVVVIIICFIIISSSSSMLAARSKLSEAGDTKKILQNATILSKTQQKGKSTVHQLALKSKKRSTIVITSCQRKIGYAEETKVGIRSKIVVTY